jgi:hypothetical protein
MKQFNRKQMDYLYKAGYEFAINSQREYARLFISPAGFTALCLDICNRVYDPPVHPHRSISAHGASRQFASTTYKTKSRSLQI